MSIELYAAYLVACFVFAIVPGPMITLIVANSLRHGTRAGLLTVAGAQLGVAVMIGIVGIGLTSIVEAMGHWFEWLRLAGAAYLVWLGWKMLRPGNVLEGPAAPRVPRGGFFAQAFLVLLSNPKALFFFGAFLPQFIDPSGDYARQIVILGVTVMVFTATTDSVYAAVSGSAGRFLSGSRVRLLSRASGGCLIGGGLWLAFARVR